MSDTRQWRVFLQAVLLTSMLSGCSGLSAQSDAFWPSAGVWRQAAVTAAKDPHTWAPAAGALVFAAGDWDEELSDWAARERPLFGSEDAARRGSDVLLAVSLGGDLVSALWVPEEAGTVSPLAVDLGALAANGLATQALKYAVGRERPDASDELSFPSGHASFAFAGAALTRRNLRRLDLSPAWRAGLGAGSTAVAGLTAWARLEAGVHYPSDVLAGAALGNFMAVLIKDAWLPVRGADMQTRVFPLSGGGMALRLSGRF